MFRTSKHKETGALQVYVANGDQNHEVSADQALHSQGRALSINYIDIVIRIGRAGVAPSSIVTSLRQNDRVSSKLQHI